MAETINFQQTGILEMTHARVPNFTAADAHILATSTQTPLTDTTEFLNTRSGGDVTRVIADDALAPPIEGETTILMVPRVRVDRFDDNRIGIMKIFQTSTRLMHQIGDDRETRTDLRTYPEGRAPLRNDGDHLLYDQTHKVVDPAGSTVYLYNGVGVNDPKEPDLLGYMLGDTPREESGIIVGDLTGQTTKVFMRGNRAGDDLAARGFQHHFPGVIVNGEQTSGEQGRHNQTVEVLLPQSDASLLNISHIGPECYAEIIVPELGTVVNAQAEQSGVNQVTIKQGKPSPDINYDTSDQLVDARYDHGKVTVDFELGRPVGTELRHLGKEVFGTESTVHTIDKPLVSALRLRLERPVISSVTARIYTATEPEQVLQQGPMILPATFTAQDGHRITVARARDGMDLTITSVHGKGEMTARLRQSGASISAVTSTDSLYAFTNPVVGRGLRIPTLTDPSALIETADVVTITTARSISI